MSEPERKNPRYCSRCLRSTEHYFVVGEHVYRCKECGYGKEARPGSVRVEERRNGHTTEK